MRLRSTPESVRAGEPTVLAIAETIFAISASTWVALHYGTVRHIAIGGCVAPFLLLRTAQSRDLGWRMWVQAHDRLLKILDLPLLFKVLRKRRLSRLAFALNCFATVAVMVLVTLAACVARVAATMATFVVNPIDSLTAISDNWRRTVLGLDLFESPELIPGPDSSQSTEYLVATRPYSAVTALFRDLRAIFEEPKVGGSNFAIAVGFPTAIVILLIITIPALVYRYSLKATAILWYPLLWACKSFHWEEMALDARLRLYLRDEYQRIARACSVVTIVGMMLKLGGAVTRLRAIELVQQLDGLLRGTALSSLAHALIAPEEIPLWQVAMFVNSLVLIWQWSYARAVLRRLDENVPVEAEAVHRRLGGTLFVRRVLGTYAIACSLYIAVQTAYSFPWPRLGTKLFPWS